MVQHDKEILNSIYGWHGKANGKAERPKCFLPECSQPLPTKVGSL